MPSNAAARQQSNLGHREHSREHLTCMTGSRRPSRGAEPCAGRTAAALTHDSAPRSRGKHSGNTTTTPRAAITSRLSASMLSAPGRRPPPTRRQGARPLSRQRVPLDRSQHDTCARRGAVRPTTLEIRTIAASCYGTAWTWLTCVPSHEQAGMHTLKHLQRCRAVNRL